MHRNAIPLTVKWLLRALRGPSTYFEYRRLGETRATSARWAFLDTWWRIKSRHDLFLRSR